MGAVIPVRPQGQAPATGEPPARIASINVVLEFVLVPADRDRDPHAPALAHPRPTGNGGR